MKVGMAYNEVLMLAVINWKNLSAAEQIKILQRPASPTVNKIEQTQQIINQVRTEGDVALKNLTEIFDKVRLDTLLVTTAEILNAEEKIDIKVKQALKQAMQQLQLFHEAQLPDAIQVETNPGVFCEMHYRAIQNVGFYIPGGTASLPSTVLMLGIPARIAGCSQRILCTPPRQDGSVDPYILYAAKLCGINKIFKIGGAQAIAAMAFGTESVLKVDKIFGPGNSWVTQAKILCSQDPEGANYDLPAGPTEQMIIADKTANPIFAAADLLSQAEHGADSQVILISDDKILIDAVNQQIEQQLLTLPRRAIAEKALVNSYAIIVDNLSEAFALANRYAPEHLLLQVANPRAYIEKIENAGSVFLGHWAPESVGDYASGTNHVLPTYGYGKSFSGLGVVDFMKRITFQELTAQGLSEIAETVETLAAIEDLQGHKRAVSLRRETINRQDAKSITGASL